MQKYCSLPNKDAENVKIIILKKTEKRSVFIDQTRDMTSWTDMIDFFGLPDRLKMVILFFQTFFKKFTFSFKIVYVACFCFKGFLKVCVF